MASLQKLKIPACPVCNQKQCKLYTDDRIYGTCDDCTNTNAQRPYPMCSCGKFSVEYVSNTKPRVYNIACSECKWWNNLYADDAKSQEKFDQDIENKRQAKIAEMSKKHKKIGRTS